jgi:hypothetical protein
LINLEKNICRIYDAKNTRSKFPVASNRQAKAVHTNFLAKVVTFGAVSHLVRPFVVEVCGFRLARQFALVLSGIGNPLKGKLFALNVSLAFGISQFGNLEVFSVERTVIEGGTLFRSVVNGALRTWTSVARQVAYG